MTSFLIVVSVMDSATRLSIRMIEQFCEYTGSECTVVHVKDIRREDVDRCDILLTIRTQSCLELAIVRYAKKMGKLYCLLVDDDFLAIPDYRTRRYLQYCALTKCIQKADVLFCTNDALGGQLEGLSAGGKFVRTDTVVGAAEVKPNRSIEDAVLRIVYYVNDGSLTAYDEIIKPLAETLWSDGEFCVEWHLIGIKLDTAVSFRESMHIYEHMDLPDFKRTLAESGFTFGIAPLLDSAFNRGKYINKFVEYTCAGLPCIYSDVEPYSSFIRSNVDGILTENRKESWLRAIRSMSDPAFRKELLGQAQSRIIHEMSAQAVFNRMLGQYPALKEYQSEKKMASAGERLVWHCYCTFGRIVLKTDVLFRIRGRLKCEGLGSLVRYSWKKLRSRKG